MWHPTQRSWRPPAWHASQSLSAPTPVRSIEPGGIGVPFTTAAKRKLLSLAWPAWQARAGQGGLAAGVWRP